MLLHKGCGYGLVKVNFGGTEFAPCCFTLPTVRSMWVYAELLRFVFCNGRTDLWDLEHRIGVGDTSKVTDAFNYGFWVREEFLKVDGDNPFVLYKLICSGDSSAPDVADGDWVIIDPITKGFLS